jgi:hypothetical protein
MDSSNHFPKDVLWQKDAFQFVDPDQFEALGIDPASVPLGTYISFRHPSQLRSRFGGNAYGFGFFEDYDRLNPDEIEKLNNVALDNPEDIRAHHKDLNEIHRKMGLLIRFSSLGHPYYLIPVHLISVSLAHIQAKVHEIVKIVDFHTKKYLKEYCNIGIMTRHDDLLLHELSFLFQDHHIFIIDSPEKLLEKDLDLDIVILTHDLFETVTMGQFSRFDQQTISKKRLEQYSIYMLWKICNLLKSEGEIFIVADHFPAKSNHTTELTFKAEQEEKRFALFSHIFNTKKKYKIKDHRVRVNIFDLQKYLSGLYVEQEKLNTLLEGKSLAELSMEEINKLPYLHCDLTHSPFLINQEKTWSGLCSIFFDEIFLKPLVPDRIKEDWGKRFSCKDYHPGNMLTFLGQKKPLQAIVADIKQDVADSNLAGCAFGLVADYRDSLEFIARTLKVLHALKKGDDGSLPRVFIDRLRQPLENKNRRFSALNHVIKLTGKIQRLEKISGYLNPDKIEGPNTPLLSNLEALTSFGFSHHELVEMILITLGHTTLGRIMSGKMSERSLHPVSEMARAYDPHQALNMLRYCRLMTMAETSAAGGRALSNEQLARLFELYESTVRVVINKELDWEQLLDEETIIMGGIRNRIVKKILTMMGYFEFLENWSELRNKGSMEKEALADYNDRKLSKIEEVIQLVNAIETFENKYLKLDPLYLPAFYRKFLDLEFHGTSHLFERMGSLNVFVLLWITVNLAWGESVNFNPILADVKSEAIDKRVQKVQEEAATINLGHLDLEILGRFSEQLDQDRSSFIMGTGFQLKTSSKNKILEIVYKDLDQSLKEAETLSEKIAGCPISQISLGDLRNLEMVFTDLEMFYQSQLRIVKDPDTDFNIPSRQRRWFEGTWKMRKNLWQNFVKVMFQPEHLHTDLRYLRRHAPVLLNFLLPEFTVLGNLDLSGNLYLNSPVTDYIIAATKKFQALVNHDRQNFQNLKLMHRLARREFGPMATGIMGVSQRQLEDLENIVEQLKTKRDLFKALTCSFIFQDVGRIPEQRAKYENEINPADLAAAGAYILEKERIGARYGLNQKSTDYLIFLVRNHALLHHTIKGEVSFSAMASILARGDKDLFDAFLITTFIMLSAIKEDLMLEDLALWIFKTSAVCHGVIDGKTTLQKQLERVVMKRGKLFFAIKKYQQNGLPKGVTPSEYLASKEWKSIDRNKRLRAGRMILATERIFRLRGIRYAEFRDLARLMMKVPLRYIHKKRKFHNVGFATFEKEVYEAFRIYKTLQSMQEDIRHFILEELIGDKVRIYGYEKVSGYLSYKNQIKLLLVGLAGTRKIRSNDDPISLNFMHMSETVEQRYEAINDFLDGIPALELWDDNSQLNHLFASETGILLRKEHYPNVLSVIFQNRVFITRKIDHMSSISDLEQLKIYFHYSLGSLRNYPFFTEDYEILLEKAFERRMMEITDMILDRTQRQMDLVKDFEDLYKLMSDLVERSRNIGFSPEQEHRLNDFYEMRKNILKREKLSEIEAILESIPDERELKKYWESIKWYLQGNRRFFGTEYELLIAQKFDATNAGICAHQA